MDFKQFTREFKRVLKEAITKVTSAQHLKPHADHLARDIKKRTRLGKMVLEHGKRPQKMKPLEDITKKTRKWAKKKGILSSDTTPAKSNLTYSGDMLDSIRADTKKGRMSIFVDVDQELKVRENKRMGREFLHVDKAQLKELEQKLKDELESAIKKGLR